jgi:hypothetical protein
MTSYSYTGKKHDPVVLILLTIVTCGIYAIYYWFITGQDINKILGYEAVNPLFLIISFVFPPLLLYYLYLIDKSLETVGINCGITYSPNFILWMLLYFICGIGIYVALFQVANYLNKL